MTNEGQVRTTRRSGRPFVLGSMIVSAGRRNGLGDDRAGCSEDRLVAWVLDGATDTVDARLFSGESDAGWWASTLDTAFRTVSTASLTADLDIVNILGWATARAREAAARPIESLQPEVLPMAAGIWLRLSQEGRAELCSIGDCVALIEPASGPVYAFGSADALSDDPNALIRAANSGKATRRSAMLESRRRLLAAGLSILTPDPNNIVRLSTVVLPDAPARVLLMTDGFYRLVDPLARFSPSGLMAFVQSDGLAAAVAILREVERRSCEPLCTLKRHDDAAAVLVEVH